MRVATEFVPEGKIRDFINGKLKDVNAEQIILQNIEKSIFFEYGYDKNQLAVDFPIKTDSGSRRASIVVFNDTIEEKQQNSDNIYIIILTVDPSKSLNHKDKGLEALKELMSYTSSKFGVWTNSKERVVLHKLERRFEVEFEEIIDFPSRGQTLEQMENNSKISLKTAVALNLLYVFRRCHDYIASNQGLQKQDAFWEFLKLIFCKIHDERKGKFEFRITNKEKSINQNLIVKSRIDKLFSDVKFTYPKIFDSNEEIELEPRVLNFVVSQLYSYDLLHSSIDVKGAAYEEIVGSNLRGDRGEFFTPRNVVKMAVSMLNPSPGKLVLDPACGTGGFLITVLKHLLDKIESTGNSRVGELKANMVKDAMNCVYGIDINPSLAKATKMNMVLNNDGQGGVFRANSLDNPSLWEDDVKKNVLLEKFDYVFTNPPFGSKLPIDDEILLQQYDLARRWDKTSDGSWIMTSKLQKSQTPEVLFIERCVQFLRPGKGKMAIVLPNGILGNPGDEYIRYWILKNCEVLASVSLPVETFLPHVGTQTSVLFLRRKSQEEMMSEQASGKRLTYSIFMAIAEKVGRDRRGNILHKRDNEGNDLLEKKENESGEIIEERVIDDDLPRIAKAYEKFRGVK